MQLQQLYIEFADDCDVSETKHHYMHNKSLVEGDRVFPHIWSAHAENVEVNICVKV